MSTRPSPSANTCQDLPSQSREASLTITVTTLAVALTAPWVGFFSDRLGRRRIIVPALFALAIPTALAGCVGGFEQLFGGSFSSGAHRSRGLRRDGRLHRRKVGGSSYRRTDEHLFCRHRLGRFHWTLSQAGPSLMNWLEMEFFVIGASARHSFRRSSLPSAGAALPTQPVPGCPSAGLGAPTTPAVGPGYFVRPASRFSLPWWLALPTRTSRSQLPLGTSEPRLSVAFLWSTSSAWSPFPSPGNSSIALVPSPRFSPRSAWARPASLSSLLPSMSAVVAGLALVDGGLRGPGGQQRVLGSTGRRLAIDLDGDLLYVLLPRGSLGAFLPGFIWLRAGWSGTVALVFLVEILAMVLVFRFWEGRRGPSLLGISRCTSAFSRCFAVRVRGDAA